MNKPTSIRDPHFMDWVYSLFLTGAIPVGIPLGFTYWQSGRSATEKMLVAMTHPFFCLVLSLISIAIVMSWRNQKGTFRFLACLLVGIVVIANPQLSGRVVRWWESQVDSADWRTGKPFDTVIVLGGGTHTGPEGTAELGSAGDRVALGARIFHFGQAKALIATGDVLRMEGALSGKFEDSDDGSQQMQLIWEELGIPKDKIFEINGQNTREEMQSLFEHPEYWKGKRCAVVTSAFHMPRALRLAQQLGMDLIPVCADHRAGNPNAPSTLADWLPSVGALEGLHMIFKEWLAARVSR